MKMIRLRIVALSGFFRGGLYREKLVKVILSALCTILDLQACAAVQNLACMIGTGGSFDMANHHSHGNCSDLVAPTTASKEE
jgi:hypothetical protein